MLNKKNMPSTVKDEGMAGIPEYIYFI
jgi:hypothetical protein